MDVKELKEAASKAIQAVDPAKIKAGGLTSELYVVVGTILAAVITSSCGIPIDPAVMTSLVALAGGYLGSRTFLKAKSSK